MGFFRFIGGMTVGIALAPFTGGGSLVAAGLASGALAEAVGSDDDNRKISNARTEGYNHGFNSGYDKGAIDTAKKFAAKLERDNNFRFAAFALGFHISKLAGNPFDKVSVIVGALGNPNSKLLDSYVRSENKKIIDGNLSFYEIKEKYLKNLSGEDLKLIDEFLQDVVDEGDYNSACSNFYNNDWKNYLNGNSSSQQENDISKQRLNELYEEAKTLTYTADELFQAAENNYYGLNGVTKNKRAKELYIKAFFKGSLRAKQQLENLYGLTLNY